MHSAVNSDDLDTLKSLVVLYAGACELLSKHRIRRGASRCIAAYKCTEEMVQYLAALGSPPGG